MKKSKNQSHRSWVVLGSLAGILVLTSILLRIMQGTPLTPDAARTIVLNDAQRAMLAIFNTRVATDTNRWKSIYIHHSRSLAGQGSGCSDHFLIGNGNGAQDGAIEFTAQWDQQVGAWPVAGIGRIEDDCVSICIVGDFDRHAPTPTQLQQLELLVQTLQERLHIPERLVWTGVNYSESPVGIGRYFPKDAFRRQLLR